METFNLTPIENEGKRVLTTAQLAESYKTSVDTINRNFNRNKERYTEGKHYYCLTGDELKEFKNTIGQFDRLPKNINTLYLWTEKGALLHAKSLNTDKAWEVYDFLVENYFQKKTPDYSALSPQLQFMIQMEQRQNALETAVKSANKRIEDMCETMQVRGDNWRKKAHALVNRIASATGSEQKDIYLDIYEELEYRAGCNLSVRFDNLYDRLYERGVSQSRLDRLNHIDVIADDKRLTEVYIAIVKEMAVKYCGGI